MRLIISVITMKYELVVAHRVCPILAKVAVCYDDKLAMVRATTISLARALNGIRTKLIVILDGCDYKYEGLFDSVFANDKVVGVDYELLKTPAIGNHDTYAKQLELLQAHASQGQFFYFSEDDYIYKCNAFHEMMDFLQNSDVDFVTPLDHPDRYRQVIPESRKVAIKHSKCCHWREVGTTCCTFMTKRQVLIDAGRLLASYGNGSCDVALWLGLTKDCVFRLFSIAIGLCCYVFGKKKDWSRCVAISAWRYHHVRLFTTRKYRLWGPMPTLAVHLARSSISPCVEDVLALTVDGCII